MSLRRPVYDDPDTARSMAHDASVCSAESHLAGSRRHRLEHAVRRRRPSAAYAVAPTVTDAAVRLAERLDD
ncbi:MAG: hypothetical protein ACRDPH_09805 [Marmoricola sp.]